MFENRSRKAMVVIGAATGIRYDFSETGRRLIVDSRDRAQLAAIPLLAEAVTSGAG